MPFVSEKQRKFCWYLYDIEKDKGREPEWDCHQWENETPSVNRSKSKGSKKPSRKSSRTSRKSSKTGRRSSRTGKKSSRSSRTGKKSSRSSRIGRTKRSSRNNKKNI